MKSKLVVALMFLIAAGISATAEASLLLIFDENGNGTYELDGGPVTPLTFTIAQDPGPGGLDNALIYFLPTTVGGGDLAICEVGMATCTSSEYSDLLRFESSDGSLDLPATQMVFYSALGGTDLADIGFPTEIFPGAITSEIVFGDGSIGFDWRPNGPAYPDGNQYIGTSDAAPVPEPATLTLFALGAGALAACRRKRA
jgi:PEP-CTERM motif